jgi:hypothetical protein
MPIILKANLFKKPNLTLFLNISDLKTNRIQIKYLSKLIFLLNQQKIYYEISMHTQHNARENIDVV